MGAVLREYVSINTGVSHGERKSERYRGRIVVDIYEDEEVQVVLFYMGYWVRTNIRGT
jgi:hypothetical protein